MDNPDRDIAETRFVYQWARDDDDADGASTLATLLRSLSSLQRRVTAIEQTLATRGSSDKTSERQTSPAIPKVPKAAPPGETLYRRAKLRVRP
jgi:hypothetical protein